MCPWCGEELTNPFTGRPVGAMSSEYDQALEAHVEGCERYLEEVRDEG